jgi:riboflavin kinase/FMN adenylyltransferase
MGYKREGNVAFLQTQGSEKGFSVHVIDLLLNDQSIISSTSIRTALLDGNIEQANTWLGRPYSLAGSVIHGDKRGRKIGFPTANIGIWSEQVIPANGVYAGWAVLDGERLMAVTNVGVRPTFEGDNITVEAYLLDFDREIYGSQLAVSFETRLRAEQRFNGLEALVAQIQKDVETARHWLQAHSPAP